MTSNATRHARRAYAREMVTLRDFRMMQDRIEYAMHAPEVGMIGHNLPRFYAYIDGVYTERATREQIAALLIEAWDNGIKTGA